MALYGNSSSRTSSSKLPRTTEFDILKASHKFLREDDDKGLSWDDQVAQKYYSNLYREFAICDLKHYKSGNVCTHPTNIFASELLLPINLVQWIRKQFALRWRTEDEVLSATGETTCGNTRCAHHTTAAGYDDVEPSMPPLSTLELPFAYEEHGEAKSALVKVVLCGRCVKKLLWKRQKDKSEKNEVSQVLSSVDSGGGGSGELETSVVLVDDRTRTRVDGDVGGRAVKEVERRNDREGSSKGTRHRRRNSRSRSPRARHKTDDDHARSRRRSPKS